MLMVPDGETFDYLISIRIIGVMAFHAQPTHGGKRWIFSKLEGERFVTVTETDGPALLLKL
jgi:hypothetical protein